MFVLFPITTKHMKQPFLTSPQATPYLKPITFKWKAYINIIIWSAQISMLEDKKRPWIGSEAVHWNTCWKLLWKKLRGPMDERKRRRLMQLRLVDGFLNWNSQDISVFVLTSVSEYSNIPWAPLEAFRLGAQWTKQPAWCLGYRNVD